MASSGRVASQIFQIELSEEPSLHKRRALHAEPLRRAHLVVGGHRIQKPHLMHAIAVVRIRIVRIQRSGIQLHLRFRFVRVQQRFLNA